MHRLNLPVIFCLLLIHFQSGCYQKSKDNSNSDSEKASQESNKGTDVGSTLPSTNGNESTEMGWEDVNDRQDSSDSETHLETTGTEDESDESNEIVSADDSDPLESLDSETHLETTIPQNETDPFFAFITDFETAEEKLRNNFVRTFVGVIQDGDGQQECPWDGSTFTLALEAPDAMFCREPENDQIAPCDSDSDATLVLEGWFEVSGRDPVKVYGLAGIENGSNRLDPYLHFNVGFDYDSPCFRERLDPTPEPQTWNDTIEYFEWQCRVSDDDEDDPVWQVCNCVID